MKAVVAMPKELVPQIFDTTQQERLDDLVDITPSAPVTDWSQAGDADLGDSELVITGWGSPLIDGSALERMPALRAIVHTAGTVRDVVSAAVWDRGDIVVASATQANAVPVAEYALAQILLAGNRSLFQEAAYHRTRDLWAARQSVTAVGNYGAVVGLIGASTIGRLVAERLRHFDVEVLITDPYVDGVEISKLGARKVEPHELYSRSDVVSLHAPDVPSTRGMVSAELLATMGNGTTFINTARPALVDEDALRAEVVSGRLAAVLDVHDSLANDDPMWDLPTVSITPHIAGSQGNELHRLGDLALGEICRLTNGEQSRHPIDPAQRDHSA
jgi:phosphoglycerate dehydrogenase-like enzyme